MKLLLALTLLLLAGCKGRDLVPDGWTLGGYSGRSSFDAASTAPCAPDYSTSGDGESTGLFVALHFSRHADVDAREAEQDRQHRDLLLAMHALSERPWQVPAAPAPEDTPAPAESANQPPPTHPDPQPEEPARVLGMPAWGAKVVLWCTIVGAVLGVLAKLGKLPFLKRADPECD